jgi:hypothetical protein
MSGLGLVSVSRLGLLLVSSLIVGLAVPCPLIRYMRVLLYFLWEVIHILRDPSWGGGGGCQKVTQGHMGEGGGVWRGLKKGHVIYE